MTPRKQRPSLRRQLVRLLPHLGLNVVDLNPGTVVVSRRADLRSLPVQAGTALVTRRKSVRCLPLPDDSTLVTGSRGLRTVPLPDGSTVVTGSPGLRTVPLPDGSAVLTRSSAVHPVSLPDGSTVLSASRGVRTLPLPDGSTIVTRSRLRTAPLPGAGKSDPASVVTSSAELRLVRVGPTQVLVGGPRPPGWLSRAHENALYDTLSSEHVVTALHHYRGNCVLDVGANKGQYATRLRAAGYTGWIVSFEPVAADFEILAQKAAQDPRWTVHQIGLGRESGEIAMNVVPGTLSSVLSATEFGAERYEQLQHASAQQVQVRRLDEVWGAVTGHVPDCRPYLKLDTQGFDLEAFAGLGKRVEELVGMQSEVALIKIYEGMPTMTEALAVYEAAGFEVSGMFPVSRERRTGRVLEFDCLMIREKALPPTE